MVLILFFLNYLMFNMSAKFPRALNFFHTVELVIHLYRLKSVYLGSGWYRPAYRPMIFTICCYVIFIMFTKVIRQSTGTRRKHPRQVWSIAHFLLHTSTKKAVGHLFADFVIEMVDNISWGLVLLSRNFVNLLSLSSQNTHLYAI